MTDLLGELAAMTLPNGITMSLTSKLTGALADLNAAKRTSACNKLRSFQHEVSAQTGKKLTAAVAASLTAQIDQIRTTAGCD